MKKTLLVAVALMVASISFAQTDLSGTWKLNAEKSKLGERSFAPKDVVLVQKDNNLSIENRMSFQGQDMTTTDKLTLDGKECINTGMMDMQRKSVATWSEDKKTLKVTTKIEAQEQVITLIESYKVDAGNLVVEASMGGGNFGETKETRIYDKK